MSNLLDRIRHKIRPWINKLDHLTELLWGGPIELSWSEWFVNMETTMIYCFIFGQILFYFLFMSFCVSVFTKPLGFVTSVFSFLGLSAYFIFLRIMGSRFYSSGIKIGRMLYNKQLLDDICLNEYMRVLMIFKRFFLLPKQENS